MLPLPLPLRHPGVSPAGTPGPGEQQKRMPDSTFFTPPTLGTTRPVPRASSRRDSPFVRVRRGAVTAGAAGLTDQSGAPRCPY